MASNEVGELKIKLSFDTTSFEKSQKEVENSAKGTYSVMKQTMGDLLHDVIKSSVNEVKKLAASVAEVGSSFDSAMSKVKAISGATASEFDALRNKAREMGKNTVFSATESAEAFNYMAMAGWDATEMIDGIEGVMNLAAAAGTDLATTSDIVTDALTAMGYGAKDAGKFADVMAAASANANTNVEMMGETFKYAASVAGSLGYNIEDTATAIGLMANAGIKSTQAGTSLRSILSRLAAPTQDVQEAMEELGVSLTDDNGEMRSLDAVMGDLRKGFSKLSATQKTEMASTIAGKNAMSGLLAIVNASEADYKKLTTAVNNSAGAAKKMANEMNNNVAGKMKLLKSQLEDIAITVWDKVSPAITKALNKVSDALNRMDWDAISNKIGRIFEKLTDAAVWIIDHYDLVVGAIQAIVAAMAVKKVADFGESVVKTGTEIKEFVGGAEGMAAKVGAFGTKVVEAVPALKAFGTGLASAATPVAGVAAGVAAVGAAMVGVTVALKDYELGLDNAVGGHARMEKSLAESQVALKSSQKEWAELKAKQEEAIEAGAKEIGNYSQLAKELDLMVDANGRVKAGYEERVRYITGELSKALGVEIQYSDGIIQKYGEVRENISKTIQSKKAELLLASQEEIYKTALEKRLELTKQIREATEQQRIASEQGRREDQMKIADHLKELQSQYEQYTISIGQYESNMELYTRGEYGKMAQTIYEYSENYTSAEDAVRETLTASVMNTASELGALKSLYEQTGNEIYLEQISTAQDQLDAQRDEMEKYFGTTEEYLIKTTESWNHNLDNQLSEITGRNIQFVEAGNGLVNMMVDGMVAKEGLSKESMSRLVDATISEIRMKNQDALASGIQLINGYDEGIRNPVAQAGVFNSVDTFGNGVISTMNRTWEEHSPSRVAERSGINLVYGVGNGINNRDAQGGVFWAVQSFASGIVWQFQNALGIHSPSTVMRDLVGKNIAAGIGVGFEDEIGDVEKDMYSEVKQLAAGMYTKIPSFDYSAAVSSSLMLETMLREDEKAAANSSGSEPEKPLIVNLSLDGRQIEQVILQDIRRS